MSVGRRLRSTGGALRIPTELSRTKYLLVQVGFSAHFGISSPFRFRAEQACSHNTFTTQQRLVVIGKAEDAENLQVKYVSVKR